jgi:uncharacterized phiE125 gp8 family phage protein
MVTLIKPSASLAVSLHDIKSTLRLETAADDALLAGWVRIATAQAEDHLGFPLLVSEFEQRSLSTDTGSILLKKMHVRDVLSVNSGGITLLPEDFVRSDHSGQTRISLSDSINDIIVRFTAGAYGGVNEIPEPIRFGIARQVVHLYTHRDAPDVALFPNAVLALWQPYRLMRIQ